ncbi:MAG: FG-GAP repeat domain-containing protein [Pyrinomonadaceae bacterium]
MQSYVGQVYVRLLGVGLLLIVFAVTGFSQNMFRKMNDFDGDGKTDFAITRTEGGSKVWYLWQSRDGFRTFQWGINRDMNAAGDYDGDGKADIAIFRFGNNFPPFEHRFWIWQSGSNSLTTTLFTNSGPITGIMQQDYNGDGKTDPAVLIGNILEPPGSGHTNVYGIYSGTAGTVDFLIPPYSLPIRAGDMTGDGRSDYVYYSYSTNPSVVNITNAATGASSSIQFGRSGDRRVSPADFDGDGIGDVAIWRSSDGNWWWIRSSDNTVRVANWGVSGDIPVTGDYDGDGVTDVAIWRPGSGQSYYWVYGSQNGINVFPWGLSIDSLVLP